MNEVINPIQSDKIDKRLLTCLELRILLAHRPNIPLAEAKDYLRTVCKRDETSIQWAIKKWLQDV